MSALHDAGEAMFLAHEGQRQIAARDAEARRSARNLLVRLGHLLPHDRAT